MIEIFNILGGIRGYRLVIVCLSDFVSALASLFEPWVFYGLTSATLFINDKMCK